MSCEILCCEVPEILQAVANEVDTSPLLKLFSLLDEKGDIDAHRAGYLEKASATTTIIPDVSHIRVGRIIGVR